MKLLTRYNRVNVITTILVMLITGIIYYQAISLILTRQKDKDLVVEEQEIFDYVALNHHLPQTFQSNDQQITFAPAAPGSIKREFINADFFNNHEQHAGQDHHDHHHHHGHHSGGDVESGRGLISSVSVGKDYYKILIVESIVETEDLIRLIFAITIALILLLLLTLVIANRLILGRLWQPFYDIMDELRLFSIADNREIPQIKTNIDEFSELNSTVTEMAVKAQHDYKDLKAFTENASHELLTPIAVINSKLDTLIQTDNFSERQSKLLNDLYSAISRLGRLNQSLLLLVKIENRLLHEKQEIDLNEAIGELIVQFEEIFSDKQLTLHYIPGNKQVNGSRYLVEILLNNLVSNAIRHNYKGGGIRITLTPERLEVKNTGDAAALEEDKIFTRFHKSSGSEGSGLGLTISRQICENFGFSLNYGFDGGQHVFIVEF